MKDDKPRPPSPESLARLKDFARRILAVPKSEVDTKVREFRDRRRGRKRG